MKSYHLAASLFLILISLFQNELLAEEPLRVGMTLSYPPFEMKDTKAMPNGFSPELAAELGRSMRRPVVILDIAFDGLLLALKSRKVDIVLSSLTITPERLETVDFSDPYFNTGLSVLVTHRSGIKELNDIFKEGFQIILQRGSSGQTYFLSESNERGMENPKMTTISEDSICRLELYQGKGDAYLGDHVTHLRMFAERPSFHERLRILPGILRAEPWGIAIAKGNDSLREQVNRFLLEAKRPGGILKRLEEKHLARELAILRKDQPDFTFVP